MADGKLLESLSGFGVLPDESDPAWDEPDSVAWELAGEFLAYADEVASRRLAEGVALLLQRDSFGDPGETMRGLRHSLEYAVDGDWPALAVICTTALDSDRAGARLWAANELAILRDPNSIDALAAALADVEPAIRGEACLAGEMLAQQHPAIASTLLPTLVSLAAHDEDAGVRRRAERAVARIQAAGAVESNADP